MARTEGTRRVLVVATAPDPGDELRELVRESVGEDAEVLVIAPASDLSFLQWLTGEEDRAREEAARRAERIAEDVPGVVEARVGDVDPLVAIEDALRTFPADEVIVVTRPEDDASWLEQEAVRAAFDELGAPVTHLVDDDAGDSPGGKARRLRSSPRAPLPDEVEGVAREIVHGRSPLAGFLIEYAVLLVVFAVSALVIAVALLVYFLAR